MCGFDMMTAAAAIHDIIGYMPQRFGLYEDLSVIENLDALRRPAGRSRQARGGIPSTGCSPSPISPASRTASRARSQAA